jgi:siroheme synthase-like protein
MNFLPICVNVDSARIVMVGGGKVALHKLKALLQYTRDVTVVGREVRPEVKALGIEVKEQSYEPSVLDGARLVYAATNDRELNRRVRGDAHARGMLVNVVDDAELCDFISPAIYKRGHMSVAVSSNGEDVKASLAWRTSIRNLLEATQPR